MRPAAWFRVQGAEFVVESLGLGLGLIVWGLTFTV